MTRACLLALALAPAAFGQFALSVRSGIIEEPIGGVYAIGSLYAGESATTRFRLRNTSSAPATVTVLAADGAGFTLSAPALPVGLEPQGVLDFQVVFQAANPGTYSAALHSDGVSVLLTVTVQPSLTFTVDGLPLGAAPIAFGPVERPSVAVRRVRIENLAAQILTVPLISVQGTGFRLASASPSGIALQPKESAGFDVEFAPAESGAYAGTLQIGDRTYALTGSAFDPPLPKPSIVLTLDQPRSARQGTIVVQLDAASRSSGTGTLTLEFQPAAAGATDPAIAFATGSRTLQFDVAPGDTRPVTLAFQTGTTAGTLTFVATLGGVTARQSVTIPLSVVTVASVETVRSAAGVELRVTGFDNTRIAGFVTYAFFDAAGNLIGGRAIQVDGTGEFARFFQSSDAGGNFLLRTMFPVTGDASRIASFEMVFTNGDGSSSTGRRPIP